MRFLMGLFLFLEILVVTVYGQQKLTNVSVSALKTIYVLNDESTIQAAIDRVNSGDTVIVKSGTYNESVEIDKAIVLKGEGIPIISGVSHDAVAIIAENVTIDGFEVTGGSVGGDDAGIHVYSGRAVIKNNVIRNNWGGIFLHRCSYNQVLNNMIENDYWYGIKLIGSSNNIISNNIIRGEGNEGIKVFWSSDNNVIHSNTIEGSSVFNVGLFESSNNIIYLNNFLKAYGCKECLATGYTSAGNVWNSPEKVVYFYHGRMYENFLGNYWDDYPGRDEDGNGIGDSPQQIEKDKNYDNYPLMTCSENYLRNGGVEEAFPVVSSPLEITLRLYYVLEIITANFEIRNDGNASITFSTLTVGGRFNGGTLSDGTYPDFTWQKDIVLEPGNTHHYQGTLTLKEAGNYHFFCTYQTPDGNWNTSINLALGLTDDDRVKDIKVVQLEGPYIVSIDPPEGAPGIEMKIRGFNFTPYSYYEDITLGGFVTFDGKRVSVKSWLDTEEIDEIVVEIPTRHEPGPVEVKVSVASGPVPGFVESNAFPFTYKEPLIEEVVPVIGLPGEKVTIKGRYFGSGQIIPSFLVRFGLSLAKESTWGDAEIIVEAPSDFGTGINDAGMMIKLLRLATIPIGEATEEVIGLLIDELGKWLVEQLGEIIEVLSNGDRQKNYKTIKFDGVRVNIGDYRIDVDVFVMTPVGKSNVKTFTYQFSWVIILDVLSAGEPRIYDSQGRKTGLVNGEAITEIPLSYCNGKTILIVNPYDSYRYEVIGTEEGIYGLDVNLLKKDDRSRFVATNIPIIVSEVHSYNIDWDLISHGNEGVVLQMDQDGDGEFERRVISDSELTGQEFDNNVPFPPDATGFCGLGTCGSGSIGSMSFIFLSLWILKITHRKHKS